MGEGERAGDRYYDSAVELCNDTLVFLSLLLEEVTCYIVADLPLSMVLNVPFPSALES